IVVMSDNGYLWGEHRWFQKVLPYEEAIRVPYVIRYDPLITSPRHDQHLVLNVDLARTFAAVGGTTMPGAEGRNLLPLFPTGADPPWRTDFTVEWLKGLGQGGPPPPYCAVREVHHTYVMYNTGEQELYDLRQDPYELQNRATDPALDAVRTRLLAEAMHLCNPPPPGFFA